MKMGAQTARALKGVRHNKLPHALALVTIGLVFLLAGAFLLLFVNVQSLLTAWKDNVRAIAYLEKADWDEAAIADILNAARQIEGVADVKFIPREQAIKDLGESLGAQAGLLKDLEENPLPDAIVVRVVAGPGTWERVEQVAKNLSGLDSVEDVEYGRAWVERFAGFLDIMTFIAVVFGALMAAAALSITAGTVRLTLYSHKDQIEIMRLVGATERFIWTPLFITTCLLGLFAGIFALTALFGVYWFVGARVESGPWVGDFALRFFSWPACAAGLVAAGLVGGLGCLLTYVQQAAGREE